MVTGSVEQVLKSTEALSPGEQLEIAERLIERARRAVENPKIDLNALAGSISLREHPLAFQARMRQEWE